MVLVLLEILNELQTNRLIIKDLAGTVTTSMSYHTLVLSITRLIPTGSPLIINLITTDRAEIFRITTLQNIF